MITTAVILSVLVLPLVGLIFFRLYENQLVRQTESELIAQAAMMAAVYQGAIVEAEPDAFPVGAERPERDPAVVIDERYAPILPRLDLALSHIYQARPAARVGDAPPDAEALRVGADLTRVIEQTQRTTLAGFRLLDAEGRVIGGRADIGSSFAHTEEVQQALAGRFSAVMRMRDEDSPTPPLYSISRGTKIRVFVAFPVFVDDRVRGVVYVSRTPDNILRNLYRERGKVAAAAIVALLAALIIGAVFVRTIARPMRELAQRAEAITSGQADAIGPLSRHGTRELASLTQSFMTMARRLSDRSNYLSSFASHVSHELKTPLTAIKGAAELMRDADTTMTHEERERFLTNVLSDVTRISALLDRLREMARADNPQLGGAVQLADLLPALRERFEALQLDVSGETAMLSLSPENAQIVFGHLLDNAQRHGAKRVEIVAGEQEGAMVILVVDDGAGVSPGNRERIFDPFFTTRRAEGGTGMGLGIVRALLRAHGGDIDLADSERGAAFMLTLPSAQSLQNEP
ncbi:MAG: HAMP domain-containing sensor histidine kinase [Hyphomonadaceae bacterium]